MQNIQVGKSSRQEVESILGLPQFSSAEWGVQVFHKEDRALRFLIYWGVWPAGRIGLNQYLLVAYSEAGIVQGVRIIRDVECDARCGEDLKLGSLNGLDLIQSVLVASKKDSARLAKTAPEPDECVVYVVPLTEVYGVSLYLDGRFIQESQMDVYFRLKLTPGEHSLSCRINDQQPANTTPGHRVVETNPRSQNEWAFSCAGGSTLWSRIELKKRAWWRAPEDCDLSTIQQSVGAKEITGHRMIIPYDPPH